MKNMLQIMLLAVICLLVCSNSMAATMYFPEGYFTQNAYGYSDAWYWGWSERHPHSSHELLSGEDFEAVYYNGIQSEPNAMYLTPYFSAPSFGTNSEFWYVSDESWDDPNNIPGYYETGRSRIQTDELLIQIDYEVADLNEGWSQVIFRDEHGLMGSRRSAQYVLLKTFSFTNRTGSPLTGVRFFKGLHSHCADEYGASIHASIVLDFNDYNDDIQDYNSFNPEHQIGEFAYHFTQWNDKNKHRTADHNDYCGFKCSIEPNSIEAGFFPGQTGRPPYGTVDNVEDMNLNGLTYAYGETTVVGCWDIPDLPPGEPNAYSITFVIHFAAEDWIHNPPQPNIPVIDINNVPPYPSDPNQYIYEPNDPNGPGSYCWEYGDDPNFRVEWDANGMEIEDARILMPITPEFNIVSFSPGGYVDGNSIVWPLGNLTGTESGYFDALLHIRTVGEAPPGVIIARRGVPIEVESYLNSGLLDVVMDSTFIQLCPGGLDIVYVDPCAPGNQTGESWYHACHTLQDGLLIAYYNGPGTIVMVKGYGEVYLPSASDSFDYNHHFRLWEDIHVYGGCAGHELTPDEIVYGDPNNYSIADGYIDEHGSVQWVFKSIEVENDSTLRGFIITGGTQGGLRLTNADVAMSKLWVNGNGNYGIYVEDFSTADLEDSKLEGNNHALYGKSSSLYTRNNVIDGNHLESYGFNGNFCVFKDNDSLIIKHTQEAVRVSDSRVQLTGTNLEGSDQTTNDKAGYFNDSDLVMTDCIAKGFDYGLKFNYYSTFEIIRSEVNDIGHYASYSDQTVEALISHSLFTGCGEKANQDYDGGLYFEETVAGELTNCTIAGNYQHGVFNRNGGDLNMTNCILYDNDNNIKVTSAGMNVDHSCVGGGFDGIGNIDADPLFKGADDFRPQPDSPCIDTGTDNVEAVVDLAGTMFPYGYGADMGCYEYKPGPDLNGDGRVDFRDFAIFASLWKTSDRRADFDGNGIVDEVDLDEFTSYWLWTLNSTDLNGDGITNLVDFAMLAEYWLEYNCSFCIGYHYDCFVDYHDLMALGNNWLKANQQSIQMSVSGGSSSGMGMTDEERLQEVIDLIKEHREKTK